MTRREPLIATGVVVALLLLSACGSEGRTASTTTPSRTAVTELPTPHSSNFLPCAGITGLSDAVQLVQDGLASLVVSASISADPGPVENNSRLLKVESYTTVAGTAENGPLDQIEEASAPDENLLPPGRYLLLLGVTPQVSTYFLSDGLRGSFALDGDSAFQRCANGADPSSPILVHDGITDEAELAGLFQQALAGDSR